MIKQVTFFAVSILFSLNAHCQYFSTTANSEIQQPPIQLNANDRISHLFDNQEHELKTDQIEFQKLDSIIYYGYDEESELWNKKSFKHSIFYDGNYRDTLILQSVWVNTNQSWREIAKEIKKYDDNNRIVERISYLIAKTATRSQYIYNTNGNIMQITESKMDSDEWQDTKKNVYSYNSENLLQADTLYNCFDFSGTSEWRQVSITDFYYTEDGSPLADTIYTRPWFYGDNFGDWELFSETAYEYNIAENSKKITVSKWDNDSKLFKPYSKEQISFQNNDLDISIRLNFKWDKTNSAWDTTEMKQFSFDDDDFIINYREQTWGTNPSNVLELFEFDYSVEKDELLLPSYPIEAFSDKVFHHKIINKESIRYEDNEAHKFRETKYYYSVVRKELPTTVNYLSHSMVKPYPNPATQCIKISFPDLFHEAVFELFNTSGEKIISKSVSTDENIYISSLKEGVYFYIIRIGTQEFVGKQVIK